MNTCYKCGRQLTEGVECFPSCPSLTGDSPPVHRINHVTYYSVTDCTSGPPPLKVDLTKIETGEDALTLVEVLRKADFYLVIGHNHPDIEKLKKFIKE